jgi:rubrerythrin
MPIPPAQILRHLAEIEEAGIRFYEGMRDGTPSDKVRELAIMMARAEARHKRRFLEYAARAGADCPLPDLEHMSPEIERLFMARVFSARESAKHAVAYASDLEVLRFAIRAEEQVAMLMTQLRLFVPPAHRRYIDRVIKEEWNHKARLEKMARFFTA